MRPNYRAKHYVFSPNRRFAVSFGESALNSNVILLGAGYQADHLRDVIRQAQCVPLAHHRHPQLPILLQKSSPAHDARSV